MSTELGVISLPAIEVDGISIRESIVNSRELYKLSCSNDLLKWAIYLGYLSIAADFLPSTKSPPQLPVVPSKKVLATLEETPFNDFK